MRFNSNSFVHYCIYCVLGCEVDLKLNTQFAADLFHRICCCHGWKGRVGAGVSYCAIDFKSCEVFMNKNGVHYNWQSIYK